MYIYVYIYIHDPGNQHVPSQGTFENDFPFPKVGYVSSLEGIYIYIPYISQKARHFVAKFLIPQFSVLHDDGGALKNGSHLKGHEMPLESCYSNT